MPITRPARVGEATAMSEQALARHERVLGHDHPDTLTVRNNLGDVYLVAGRVHEAIAVFEQTLADAERILGLVLEPSAVAVLVPRQATFR